MKRVLGVIVALVLLVGAFVAGWVAGRTGIVSLAVDPATLGDAERQFADRMRNVSLVGHFTVDGRDDRNAVPDRYDISAVEKVGDSLWRFTVRMRDSGNLAIPVTVPMRWVGTTPVIDMANYAIPGLGTFSAHVVFDGNRYAGTWSNPKVGGLMYGKIESIED